MKDKLIIEDVIISNNRIDYKYSIDGELKEAFNNNEKFFAEYNYNISNTPESIAIIPLICNILPIIWLYDAELYIKSCDEDFFNSIEEFKKGYIKMYPDLEFKGKIFAEKLVKNSITELNGAICFFSGGVDAFNTLLNHINENITMLTLWGADVTLQDNDGWNNVLKHLEKTANDFKTNYISIKSNLRNFYKKDILNKRIESIGKEWWHDFQHGIGIISFAAPISFLTKKQLVYFASSFTAKDIGQYTCASDPTIDNYLKFCDVKVIHDGYEFTRQDKVHNIVEFCRKNNKKIELRVCWESTGGKNCCHCEKCYRTMLALFAEGEDPKNYGFDYTKKLLKKIRYCQDRRFTYKKYEEIQSSMRKNCNINDLPKEIRWFYKINIKKLGCNKIYKILGKIKRKVKRIFKL